MSRNVVDLKSGVSVAASSSKRISHAVNLSHTWDFVAHIVLSAASETTGITFKLQDSFDNGATWFDVGDQSQATLTIKTAASATNIANATGTITITTHGFANGEAVIFNAGTAAPAGLVDGATYYVVLVDTDSFKLASSFEDAIAGNAVSFTDDGSGTQSFYKAVYEIRMVRDDATDLAQLPLNDLVQFVCVTGASDSCTVSKIYLKERW